MKTQWIFFGLILIAAKAHTQNPWTLNDCIQYASTHTIDIQNAELNIKRADVRYRSAKNALYPSLNFQANTGYQFGLNIDPTTNTYQQASILGGSSGIQLEYVLFNWNQRQWNKQAAKYNLMAAKWAKEKTIIDHTINVVTLYYQALLRYKQWEQIELQMNYDRALLIQATKQIQAGTKPDLDGLLIRSTLATDTAQYIQSFIQSKTALMELQVFLNRSVDSAFAIDTSDAVIKTENEFSYDNPRSFFEAVYQHLPNYQLLLYKKQTAAAEVQLYKAQRLPTLSLVGNLNTRFANNVQDYTTAYTYIPSGYVNVGGTNYEVNNLQAYYTNPKNVGLGQQLSRYFGQQVQLTLQVPILNQYKYKTAVANSLIGVEQTKVDIDQDRNAVEKAAYQVFYDMVTAKAKLASSTMNANIANQALLVSRKRYDLGLLNIQDFLATQNQLFKIRIEKIINQYDYWYKQTLLRVYLQGK